MLNLRRMTSALLFVLACVFPSGHSRAEPPTAAWEFRDEPGVAGRTLIEFRPLEWAVQPAGPLDVSQLAGRPAKYALLQIGAVREREPHMISVDPEGADPQLWIDGDADGRISEEEVHKMPDKTAIEATVMLDASRKPESLPVARTLLVKRNAAGNGLLYAVRGFTSGTIAIGAASYPALLVDHNGDGCFDARGRDRTWIDLDGDGKWNPFAEQFLLGTPIKHGEEIFLVKPDAAGLEVEVVRRPTEKGTLQVTLDDVFTQAPAKASVHLVGEWGELVRIEKLGAAIEVPAGKYRMDELTCEVADENGRSWTYRFVGGSGEVEAIAGDTALFKPLAGLEMSVHCDPPKSYAAGERIRVSPRIESACGLELVNCEVRQFNIKSDAGPTAKITLVDGQGKTLDRIESGFQ